MSTEAAGRPDGHKGPEASNESGAACRADQELVSAALSGGQDAMDSLVDRLRCVPRILAARNARMGSPLGDHELEDLSQDTLCVVWRKLGEYNGSARLETWIFRFCFLELLKRLRDFRNKPRPTEDLESSPELSSSPPEAPVDSDHIHEGLDRLDPDEADAVRLKHFEGLTLREVGERLGQSENTIKGRYYRGIRKLRVLLGETTPERGDGSFE